MVLPIFSHEVTYGRGEDLLGPDGVMSLFWGQSENKLQKARGFTANGLRAIDGLASCLIFCCFLVFC